MIDVIISFSKWIYKCFLNLFWIYFKIFLFFWVIVLWISIKALIYNLLQFKLKIDGESIFNKFTNFSTVLAVAISNNKQMLAPSLHKIKYFTFLVLVVFFEATWSSWYSVTIVINNCLAYVLKLFQRTEWLRGIGWLRCVQFGRECLLALS